MATSQLAHSAAASLLAGASARLATNAKATRSMSVVNRRPPSTSRSAVSIPSCCHSPSSSHAPPAGREPVIVSPPPTGGGEAGDCSPTAGFGADLDAGVGAGVLAEIAVDRPDQPPQARHVEAVLPAQRQQHLGHRRPTGAALVVRDRHVSHRRPVPVPPRRRPQVHTYTLAADNQDRQAP